MSQGHGECALGTDVSVASNPSSLNPFRGKQWPVLGVLPFLRQYLPLPPQGKS